ncbi:MAG: DUF664 domain-containing protein [Spirochaetales bacterium]|jgi:uncharacterized damage-inducible protein DinB|nr:DUF664 domain-containing protein [Spirochaetales bacterium]
MSRGRKYNLDPVQTIPDPETATAAAFLIEAEDRLIDLVETANQTQLHFKPEGSYLSMANLTKHMTWAEMVWISKISTVPIPHKVQEFTGTPAPQALPELTEGNEGAHEFISTIHTLRTEYTIPALAKVTDFRANVAAEGMPGGPDTVGKIISHLIWHWTYHTGQVGLLLLQGGFDYSWSFEKN